LVAGLPPSGQVRPLRAQEPGGGPGLRGLRLRTDSLRIVTPAAFGGRLAAPGDDAAARASRWQAALEDRLAVRAAARWRVGLTGDSALLEVRTFRGPAWAAGRPVPVTAAQRPASLIQRYADLGVRMNALLDLRFERLQNLRCTAADANSYRANCNGSFTPPRFEPQFDVRSGGVVAQRVHVNVDYDTQREFDASNNIQVHYQGLDDEILRRVEVGNVTFAAPASRFITGGIPSNNFGVAAQATLGALDIGGIYAQQKGNVVKSRLFTVGATTVQPVDRVLADRDFETQRFFFVRDPRAFPGYPALDVLAASALPLPDTIRVTQVRVYRYRSTVFRAAAENNLSGLQAVALRRDSPQRAGPITWEVLVEGRDYYLDPSGLWFALASRLDQEDFLAVSYVTAAGDTVGTFPAAGEGGRVDTLELIHLPRTGPDVPTFYYEMRNTYRIGSLDDITRTSVAAAVAVGGSQRPSEGAATFLALLGIAQETDATLFDQYNRMFPRDRDPARGAPLREYFVIFPSLTPFADSTRLSGAYRTDSLYRTPTYLLRTQGPAPLYQIGLQYEARGGDSRGMLQLGGFQIRQGSERVVVDGRTLVRNVDYTVNYEVGQLTFVDPDRLFPRPTTVAVQFEENQAFTIAPTNITGLHGRYDLGDHGSISGLGLLQRQRSTYTRPQLGFEPSSNFVLGIVGNLRFRPDGLTRFLDALPLIRTEVASALDVDAELATSRPSPNQVGTAYIETFEGESGLFLPLNEGAWEYGSRPSSPQGVEGTGIDPVTGFDDTDAAILTWQNLIPSASGGILQLLPQDIDPSIIVQGTGQSAETVLWMTLQPDTIGGLTDPTTFRTRWYVPHTPGPRWRTISLPLSASGVDLSRSEFLEFWVLDDEQGRSRRAGLSFVLDFGTVYEDAVDFQPTEFTVSGADTTYTGRRRSGEGRLDTERDTLTATFNAALDDNGILGDVADSILNADVDTVAREMPLCTSLLGQGLTVYDWGSTQPHCTRRNGLTDSEDLDNDQHLDTLVMSRQEDHLRFVWRIIDDRYFVRTGGVIPGMGTWKLYRVPFRLAAEQVGAPDVRRIRALRLAVTAPSAVAESTVYFAVARMRLLGAPWVKRASTPVQGLAGLKGELHGEVVASVVTTENETDLGYEPPPGVTDQGSQVGTPQIGSVQINERSLRLVATDVRAGERAEAYYRFPEGDRNFLGYREMRVWARGRGAGWESRELTFFVKVGQDENNFYLYRTSLATVTWEPELVVDFERWFALRSIVEGRFLSGEAPSGAAACGGDTLAYVACDGPYLVHVRSPGIAPPNLSRVQELAVGFLRDSGSAADTSEVWVDDIRLSGVVNTPGVAGAVNVRLTAADVADVSVALTRRDGNFRQLGENPSYVTQNALSVSTLVRLERFGLDRLGLAVPLSIRTERSSQDPYFLNGTDVLAAELEGLRRPQLHSTSYGISIRRVRRGDRWWQRGITDNLGASGTWSNASAQTELSTGTSRLSDVRVDYGLVPGDRNVRTLPAFLRAALDGLPAFLRNNEGVKGLRDSRLRLTPVSLTLATGVSRSNGVRSQFRVPIVTPLDTAAPVGTVSAILRSNLSAELRPFSSLSLGLVGSWDRDLRDYGDSTPVGALTETESETFLGMDVGFLRQQVLGSRLTWNPTLASWLRLRYAWSSEFALTRDPNARIPERTEGDSAGGFRIPTTFGSGATSDVGASLDLSRLLGGLLGDSSGLRSALERVSQFDLARRRERRSQFDRPGFDPDLGYRLGLDGLGGMLEQEGRLAEAATDSRQDRVNVGVRLPAGLVLTGQYGEREQRAWFLRGAAHQLQTATESDWPNVTARWSWSPRSEGIRRFVRSVTASVGWQERASATAFPSPDAGADSLGALRFTQDSRSRPMSLSLAWAPGLTTSVSLGSEESRAERSGSQTLGDRRSVAGDVTFSFRPPRDILPLPSDIRSSLRALKSLATTCVLRAGTATCTPIADSRRSELSLTMDTDMPPSVTAGLALGYVLNDDRHVNRKFSQFTATISIRVYFAAGEVR
jgi:hypothetical protein